MEGPMVFISYSWREAAPAHAFAARLMALGQRVWIDHQDLDLTFPVAAQLVAALRRSRLVVVLDTPHVWRSTWVAFELAIATRARIPIMRLSREQIAGT